MTAVPEPQNSPPLRHTAVGASALGRSSVIGLR